MMRENVIQIKNINFHLYQFILKTSKHIIIQLNTLKHANILHFISIYNIRYKMTTQKIWYKDPFILLKKDEISSLWYSDKNSLAKNANSYTRLVLFAVCILYFLTLSKQVVYYGVIAVIGIAVYYSIMDTRNTNLESFKKAMEEGFENPEHYEIARDNYTTPTPSNPMMNVTQNEYSDDPQRHEAAKSYVEPVVEEINQSVKSNLDARLFRNMGDEIDFENSMRQFHTTPNTTIPNNQMDFAKFCYGGMESCKEGSILQCEKNNFRYNLR